MDDPLERVTVHAKKKIDKFEAQKTIKTSGAKYKPTPGEHFIPDLELRPGATWPTLEEYIQAEIDKSRESTAEDEQP